MPEDNIDEWAAQFTRWTEFAKAHNLTKSRRMDYQPTCYVCKGTGYVITNRRKLLALMNIGIVTIDSLGDAVKPCTKCRGRGVMSPKPKYADVEIRETINALGKDKVQRLITQYKKGRRK